MAYCSSGNSMIGCFHEGNIFLEGWDNSEIRSYCYVGGFFGDGSIKKLENCYSKGDITGNGYVGGLFGYSSTTSQITCTYVLGNLKAKYGYYVGGIAGYMSKGNITNSYYIGEINEGISAAPSITMNDICCNSSIITDSKKLTKEEAKNQGSFVGFDFEKTWQMGEESPKFKTSE